MGDIDFKYRYPFTNPKICAINITSFFSYVLLCESRQSFLYPFCIKINRYPCLITRRFYPLGTDEIICKFRKGKFYYERDF